VDRFGLLRGDTSQDDQLLETDVMRFAAIIGIVFWIIFALVKSIPFKEPRTKMDDGKKGMSIASPMPMVQEDKARPRPAPPVQPPAPEPSPPTHVATHRPPAPALTAEIPGQAAFRPVPPVRPAEPEEEKPKSVLKPPEVRGVLLQFESLDGLMELVKAGRVELYGRARATGFDLFFSGLPDKGGVRFRGVTSLPEVLWEIRSGREREWFLEQMALAYPAIRAFPDKQVLVHFSDSRLEEMVDRRFQELKAQGANGILSVTGAGELIFNGR